MKVVVFGSGGDTKTCLIRYLEFSFQEVIIMQYKRLTDEKSIYNAIEQFHSEFSTLSERVDLREYSNKLAQHSSCELMVKDTEVVGIVAMYTNSVQTKTAFVTLIGIHNEFQGKGYGTILLKHCCEIAQNAGMNKIRLEVDNSNTKAGRFYQKHGFLVEGYSGRQSRFLVKLIKNGENDE